MGIFAEAGEVPGEAPAKPVRKTGGYLLLSGASLDDNEAGAVGLEQPWRGGLAGVSLKVTTHERRQVFRGDLNAVEAEVLGPLLAGQGMVRVVPPGAEATSSARPE